MVQPAPATPQTQPPAQPQPGKEPPATPETAKPPEVKVPAGPTAAEFATLKTERDALQDQVTQTSTAVETLRTEMNQMRLQGVPTEQRAAAQRDLDLQAEERRLQTQAAGLNKAALAVMAQDIANKTGVDVAELRGFGTTTEMQEFAINRQVELQQDPDYVGAMARLHGYVKVEPDPNAPPPPAQPGKAPGATQQPAGAPSQNAGTQPLVEDPISRIMDDPTIGRGSGNLEGALEAIRNAVGMTDLVFVGADKATPESDRPYQPPPPAGTPPTQPGQVPGAEAGNPPGAIDVVNTKP